MGASTTGVSRMAGNQEVRLRSLIAGAQLEATIDGELDQWKNARDRLHDVLEHLVADEVVEVDPHPAGLDALAAAGDLALELVAGLEIDPQQPVAVRTRA